MMTTTVATWNTLANHFMGELREVLKQYPAGISEYDLIQCMRARGYFGFLDPPPATPLDLFRAHFLLFHALYLLRDRLWEEGGGVLDIHTLKIQILPYQTGEGALGAPDTVRDYYLDLGHLEETTQKDVNELIAGFWTRFSRLDKRSEALAELGLEDPVDDATIKNTYRRLAMEHHPDRGGDKERLQAINAAVKTLLGP